MAPPKQQNANAQSGQTAQLSAKVIYDRKAAIDYAENYWDKTCSDGFVAVSKEPTAFRRVVPTTPFVNAGVAGSESAVDSDNVLIPYSDLDDCTHFVSCCVGRPWDAAKLRPMLNSDNTLPQGTVAPEVNAGGLKLGQQWLGQGAKWMYGFCSAPEFVAHLLAKHGSLAVRGKQFMTLAEGDAWFAGPNSGDKELSAGDVIALAKNKSYSHIMIYAGQGNIYCHTRCRNKQSWRINTSSEASYTFIHIRDA